MKIFIAAEWRDGMKNSVGPSFMYRIVQIAFLFMTCYLQIKF